MSPHRPRSLGRVLALAALAIAGHSGPAVAGYTHYWTWRAPPDPEALRSSLEDMRRLVEASRDIVAVDREGAWQARAERHVARLHRGDLPEASWRAHRGPSW